MNVLVTGSAGFIGSYLIKELLSQNYNVTGIDNLNDYYDIDLKLARLSNLKKIGFKFYKIDINNIKVLKNFIFKHDVDIIIHLAAQAGVRYSIKNPQAYFDNNIKGIVIGLPINLDGTPSQSSQSAKDLAINLSKDVTENITMWDERLSSQGAFNLSSNLDINTSKKVKKLDENAAQFILQGALDYLTKENT